MSNKLQEPLSIRSVTLRNRVILAPVDGVFDAPCRKVYARFGPGLTVSEMISARSIGHARHVLKRKAAHDVSERPFCVQLADHDPVIMAEAARVVIGEGFAEMIDLNMGCPSKQVTGSGNGSALLKTPELIEEIVRQVRRAIDAPLSVKFRLGWNESARNEMEVAKIIEGEGADWMTLHPRTRAQMFGGHSEWERLAAVKAAAHIPVIGNGDVTSAAEARRMLAETGVDGVMVARGAFGDPWLLCRLLTDDDTYRPSHAERLQLVLDHLHEQGDFIPERQAITAFRKHVGWYVKGIRGAAPFRLAVMRLTTQSEVEDAFRRFFATLGD